MHHNEHHQPGSVPASVGGLTELSPGASGPESLSDTEQFLLETLERLDESDTETENLKKALEHSRDIGAAVGVLMAFEKLTQDEAFQLLRHASQDQNVKLYTLAREVLDTGQLPAPSHGPE